MNSKLLILRTLEDLKDDINRTLVDFNTDFTESTKIDYEQERNAALKKLDEISNYLAELISAGKEFGIA